MGETCSRCRGPRGETRFKTCDKCRAGQKRWRDANPDKQSAANRSWRARNPVAARSAQAAWAARNPDYWKHYQETYRDRLVEAAKAWALLNREAVREKSRRRRARMRQVLVIDFSASDLEARLSMYHGKCWICKERDWEHVDHVKPLARGGAHILANLRPACGACNRSKGATWPPTT